MMIRKFVATTATLALLSSAALAQGAGGGQDSDDPMGFSPDTYRSETMEMPKPYEDGNVLMGKTVVSSDGEVLGVVGSVAQEAGNRERMYVTRSEAMGGGTFSIVVPENYMPGEQIEIGMSAADAKAM